MVDLFKDEKILITCRRHWLVFAFAILNIAALFTLVVIAPFFLEFLVPDRFDGANLVFYEGLVFFAAALVVQILWMVLFLIVADYYLDVWIVTDHRLIFIELHGLFSRTVSSVHLRNIQDVSTDIRGILPTLLKFGNVRAQSAATAGEFIFKQVANPNSVKDLILHAKEKFLSESGAGAHGGE